MTKLKKVYIEVNMSKEEPKTGRYYMTNLGFLFLDSSGFWTNGMWFVDGVSVWYKQIELPTEEEINEEILKKKDKNQTPFMRGIDYILKRFK